MDQSSWRRGPRTRPAAQTPWPRSESWPRVRRSSSGCRPAVQRAAGLPTGTDGRRRGRLPGRGGPGPAGRDRAGGRGGPRRLHQPRPCPGLARGHRGAGRPRRCPTGPRSAPRATSPTCSASPRSRRRDPSGSGSAACSAADQRPTPPAPAPIATRAHVPAATLPVAAGQPSRVPGPPSGTRRPRCRPQPKRPPHAPPATRGRSKDAPRTRAYVSRNSSFWARVEISQSSTDT